MRRDPNRRGNRRAQHEGAGAAGTGPAPRNVAPALSGAETAAPAPSSAGRGPGTSPGHGAPTSAHLAALVECYAILRNAARRAAASSPEAPGGPGRVAG